MAYTTSAARDAKGRRREWKKPRRSRDGFDSTDKLSTSNTESDKLAHSRTMKALRTIHSVNLMSVISTKSNGGTNPLDHGYHTGSNKYSANSCWSFPIFSSILSEILSFASLGAIPFGCISKHAWFEQTDTRFACECQNQRTLYEFVNARWYQYANNKWIPIFNSFKNFYWLYCGLYFQI